MDLYEFIRGLPPTRRIYFDDSYIASFNATVLKYGYEGRNIYIVLDATAFHPKSGGQPSDTGSLTSQNFKSNIKKAMLLNDVIVHFGVADGSLSPKVLGTVNWEHRYLYMRRHTGGHLLDHCLSVTLGKPVETSNSWLGEGCYVAYIGKTPSERSVLQAFELANKLIRNGCPVRVEEVELEELLRRAPYAPNIHRLPSLQRYRIVTIEGCTPIPCAGTHLHNIREIGELVLKKIEQLEKEFRIYYDVGAPNY
ncbi:MAG: alanyl-tRNA editing protein [Candidatus Bathyarchaeia archaeon]